MKDRFLTQYFFEKAFKKFIFFYGCLLLFISCGKSGSLQVNQTLLSGTSGLSCGVVENSLTVSELYPGYTRWNDYVVRASTTTACSDANRGAGNNNNCIHAGERRKMDLPVSVTSCTNITATDALGVFDWKCDDSGTPVFVYSYRLKEGKGLKDLINTTTGTAWLSNSISVDVSSCSGVYSSASSNTWWTNTLAVLPNLSTATGVQTLNTAYEIYTVPSGTTGSSNGFDITADGVGIVTLDTETLSFYGTAANQMILVNAVNFAWIEGKYNAAPAVAANRATNIIEFDDSAFSRVHNATLTGADDAAIFLDAVGADTQNSLFTEIKISESGFTNGGNDAGILLWNNSKYNTFHKIRVANSLFGNGIADAAGFNVFNKVNVSNTLENNAFDFNGGGGASNESILTEATAIGTVWGGRNLNSQNSNTGFTAGFVTLLNGEDSNLLVNSSNDTTIFQLSSVVGSATLGIEVAGSDSCRFAKIADYTTAASSIDLDATSDTNEFIEGLFLSNTGCNNAGTNNWLAAGTCNYGSATPVIAPDSITLNLEGAMLGRVPTDNSSPHATGVVYNTMTDFISLDNLYRGWGKYDTGQATELHHDHRGGCSGADNCAIYDVRLSATGTDITNVNGTFSSGACPTSVDSATASNVLTNKMATPLTFLINAVEIMFDDIGNDNGLCESNESCIFAPHIGSYLGEGDYENNGSCTYTGGNGVTNYTIYGYPTVGATE